MKWTKIIQLEEFTLLYCLLSTESTAMTSLLTYLIYNFLDFMFMNLKIHFNTSIEKILLMTIITAFAEDFLEVYIMNRI